MPCEGVRGKAHGCLNGYSVHFAQTLLSRNIEKEDLLLIFNRGCRLPKENYVQIVNTHEVIFLPGKLF